MKSSSSISGRSVERGAEGVERDGVVAGGAQAPQESQPDRRAAKVIIIILVHRSTPATDALHPGSSLQHHLHSQRVLHNGVAVQEEQQEQEEV